MKKKISLVLLIIWMIVIFWLSACSASESSSQSGFLTGIVCKIFNIKNVELASTIIRKLAHLTEFFILGVLTINYIRFYSIKHKYLISIGFCFLYACSDEFHQMFVPGRAGQITDVLIDVFGVILGCGIFYIISKFHKNTCKKRIKHI